MDFITLRGIQTRTGVDKKHLPLFVLKEMMDNALDYVEKSGSGNITTNTTHQKPKVTVFITLEANSLLHIRVSNSNHSNKGVFTEDTVRKIFSYTSSMSSKRNQFKITRGALGDAFKELLSIPYALAIEGLGFDKWEKPLIIRDSASRKEFTVKLVVDKANQSIEPIFAIEDLSSADSSWYHLPLYKTYMIHEIQVDLFLPFDSSSAAEFMIRKFKDLLNPGFLFDRTDRALLKKRKNTMTISKYEQTLTDQSRHIIESDEIMKPILDKIEDLDNDLR